MGKTSIFERILGVNGGNGVILHPSKERLVANIDLRPVFKTPGNAQWRANFGKIPVFNKDIPKLEEIDVIIGAPDCGHSSALALSRAKKFSDPSKNDSMALFLRFLKKKLPKVFLMENLAKMLENYPTLEPFLEKKYRIIKIIGPVSLWGNSQITRKRLVMIGVRRDMPLWWGKFFKKLPKKPELKKCWELMEGLEKPSIEFGNIREPETTEITLYTKDARKITTQKAKKIWNTEFKGKGRWEVNKPRMKNQPGVYRNLKNNYPKTVTKAKTQFNYRGEVMTPRELARIQGIPDSFRLWMDADKPTYSINKGRVTVTKSPPYEIGKWFYNTLLRIEQANNK